jgi:hypothetical protein
MAIDVGQAHVQQEDIGRPGLAAFQRLPRAGGGGASPAFFCQSVQRMEIRR